MGSRSTFLNAIFSFLRWGFGGYGRYALNCCFCLELVWLLSSYLVCVFPLICFSVSGWDTGSRRMNGFLALWKLFRSRMYCLPMLLFQLVPLILHVLLVCHYKCTMHIFSPFESVAWFSVCSVFHFILFQHFYFALICIFFQCICWYDMIICNVLVSDELLIHVACHLNWVVMLV